MGPATSRRARHLVRGCRRSREVGLLHHALPNIHLAIQCRPHGIDDGTLHLLGRDAGIDDGSTVSRTDNGRFPEQLPARPQRVLSALLSDFINEALGKNALCECPTERQNPTGTPMRRATWAICWFAMPWCKSNNPSAAILSDRSSGPDSAGSVRSIQRGVMASPAMSSKACSRATSAPAGNSRVSRGPRPAERLPGAFARWQG